MHRLKAKAYLKLSEHVPTCKKSFSNRMFLKHENLDMRTVCKNTTELDYELLCFAATRLRPGSIIP
jgi:hypothetical protein